MINFREIREILLLAEEKYFHVSSIIMCIQFVISKVKCGARLCAHESAYVQISFYLHVHVFSNKNFL